jgi:hypothetical protein
MVKKTRRKRKKPVFRDMNFLLWLVLLFLVIAAIVSITTRQAPQKDVAATVNGEKIYVQDLDAQYSRVPDTTKAQLSRSDFLGQLIDKTLLLQEAAKEGIVANESMVDPTIEQIKAQLPEGTTLDQLLKDQKLTMDELKKEIREQLVIAQFLDENVLANVSVSGDEFNEYVKNMIGEDVQLSNDTLAQIRDYLLLQKQRAAFDDYMSMARSGAAIEIVMKEEGSQAAGSENATPGTAEANVSSGMASLVDCLNSKDAVLYGSEGCSFTKQQLEILGANAGRISFVECADADGTLSADCEKLGVEVFPTWSIDGKLYRGTYTLEQLKAISGC